MSSKAPWPQGRPGQVVPVFAACLAIWLLLLAVLPDPRPLAAPEWAVERALTWTRLSAPTARLVVSMLLRAAGIAVLGMLLGLALSRLPLRQAAPGALIGTPCLAVAVKWINFGYFPVTSQLAFIVAVAVASALAGLAMRRSRVALLALGVFGAGLFAWGTSTRITDDLYAAARITGELVIERFGKLPADDPESFARLTEVAFAYAEDNSHGVDPVFANRAAILALGVILGEDQVAVVARREVDPARAAGRQAFRSRVLVHGRGDLSQHFWVSGALTVVADAGRALTVGLAKEMKDSTPGGSGFSFVDMLANKAGIRFAVVATRDAGTARDLQLRIARGIATADFFPAIDGLPEGLSRDEFQSAFGGLGSTETRRLFTEIDRRIAGLPGLQPTP
jgi:hypothetical protein